MSSHDPPPWSPTSAPAPEPSTSPWTAEPPVGAAAPATYPPVPVVVSPLPVEPREYHHMLRTPRARWWKGLLAIVSFVAAYLLVSVVLQGGAVFADVAAGRSKLADLQTGKISVTPLVLLSVNLTNAAAIPIAMLLQWAFFGQRPRWLSSVQGMFRWRLLARSAVIVLPLWLAYIILIALVPSSGEGKPLGKDTVAYLVIVLLTTPLQAAGEEYGARGLISRSAASWVADPRVALGIGTAISALVFTLGHGAGDPWLIVFYFVFGVGMSVVTWRTGGLEAAIVIHSINNLLLFLVGILSGEDLSQSFDRSAGSGSPAVLLPMAMIVLTVALIWWWARRRNVPRVFQPEAPAPVLTGPPPSTPAPGGNLPPGHPTG